jgi:adenosylcobinamide-GDP ribazoletransferase
VEAVLIPIGLRASARLLTVLPLRYDAREAALPSERMLPWFPAVGAAIGLAVSATLLLPLPALPRAAVALAVWTLATGGLHEDGFLDVADAAFAPVTTARRLEILKDPHVGAHAAIAGALLVVLRFAALAAVVGFASITVWAAAVIVAAVVGRWCMTLTLTALAPARTTGLGARYGAGAHWLPPTLVALALVAVATLLADPLAIVTAVATGAAAAFAAAAFLVRRFGGATGDVHGAAGLLAETAALYGFLLVL